ncbi:unnamed protein product [Timema podura]|uniref:Uncharacterized protein n=1 Tax=Timema podura TaxID=61482 RepID=A0ABN7NKV8_TIMPD|nr:unnamed protein product [Timema podura]
MPKKIIEINPPQKTGKKTVSSTGKTNESSDNWESLNEFELDDQLPTSFDRDEEDDNDIITKGWKKKKSALIFKSDDDDDDVMEEEEEEVSLNIDGSEIEGVEPFKEEHGEAANRSGSEETYYSGPDDILADLEDITKEETSFTETPASPVFSSQRSKKLSPPQDSLKTMIRNLDTKCLGLNKDLGSWLDVLNDHSALSKVSSETTEETLKQNVDSLNDIHMQILEKINLAFEAIPLELLKLLPGFDNNTFVKLRTLRQKIKAKIKLTESFNLNESCRTNVSSQTLKDVRPPDHNVVRTSLIGRLNESSISEVSATISKSNANASEPLTEKPVKTSKFVFKKPSALVKNMSSVHQMMTNDLNNSLSPIRQESSSARHNLSPLNLPKGGESFFGSSSSSSSMNTLNKSSDSETSWSPANTQTKTSKSWSNNSNISVLSAQPASSKQATVTPVKSTFSKPSETNKALWSELDDDKFLADYCIEEVESPNKKSPYIENKVINYTSSIFKPSQSASGSKKRPTEEGVGQFNSNIKNDGTTGEFDGLNYPHTSEMLKIQKVRVKSPALTKCICEAVGLKRGQLTQLRTNEET